jgi:hypothetical protein
MPEPMEAPEQETTCVCPNCGATLKIEVEAPEAEAAPEGASAGPSIRDALAGAMGGQ